MTNTTIAKLATAKSIDDKTFKALSETLEPGIITVDSTIRIVGGLKKGAPFKKRVSAAANPWKLLAKALSKLNQTSIEALVRESLEASDDETSAVKQAAEDAIERIVAATEREMSGALTGTVRWELLA